MLALSQPRHGQEHQLQTATEKALKSPGRGQHKVEERAKHLPKAYGPVSHKENLLTAYWCAGGQTSHTAPFSSFKFTSFLSCSEHSYLQLMPLFRQEEKIAN